MPAHHHLHSIDAIRATSRRLVRELGFMSTDLAGTDLPPSAVHALIEIEGGGVTARDLGARLRLEKSSVSRMLRKLVDSGDVRELAAEGDGRVKLLSLTASGKARVAAIHAFARAQVADALSRLQPGQTRAVLEGLRLYTDALAGQRDAGAAAAGIRIESGYRPGIIARITEMHARYYSQTHGLGQHFESVVAGGLAAFADRLHAPVNQVWVATAGDAILGSIAIDGEDMGPGIAHLRWYIVDDALRGTGCGKALLDTALAFADAQGFSETHLFTFSGLDAARHLYEQRGFVLAQEGAGSQWGKEVMEQRFVRKRTSPRHADR